MSAPSQPDIDTLLRQRQLMNQMSATTGQQPPNPQQAMQQQVSAAAPSNTQSAMLQPGISQFRDSGDGSQQQQGGRGGGLLGMLLGANAPSTPAQALLSKGINAAADKAATQQAVNKMNTQAPGPTTGVNAPQLINRTPANQPTPGPGQMLTVDDNGNVIVTQNPNIPQQQNFTPVPRQYTPNLGQQ